MSARLVSNFKSVICDIQAMDFLQLYVIMPSGRLRETENKEYN